MSLDLSSSHVHPPVPLGSRLPWGTPVGRTCSTSGSGCPVLGSPGCVCFHRPWPEIAAGTRDLLACILHMASAEVPHLLPAHLGMLMLREPLRSCIYHLPAWAPPRPYLLGPRAIQGLLNSQGSQLGGGPCALFSLVPKQQARDPPPPGIALKVSRWVPGPSRGST